MPAKKPIDPEMSAAAKKRVAGYQRGPGGRFAPKTSSPLTIDTLTAHSQAAADLGNQLGHSPALRHALEQVADANRQIEQLKGRITGLQEALGEAKAEARTHKSQMDSAVGSLEDKVALIERIQSIVGGQLMFSQLPGAVEHLRERADRAMELEQEAETTKGLVWQLQAKIGDLEEVALSRQEVTSNQRDTIEADRLRINNLREDLNGLSDECERLQVSRDIYANELAATKTELEAISRRGFWARVLNLGVAK